MHILNVHTKRNAFISTIIRINVVTVICAEMNSATISLGHRFYWSSYGLQWQSFNARQQPTSRRVQQTCSMALVLIAVHYRITISALSGLINISTLYISRTHRNSKIYSQSHSLARLRPKRGRRRRRRATSKLTQPKNIAHPIIRCGMWQNLSKCALEGTRIGCRWMDDVQTTPSSIE